MAAPQVRELQSLIAEQRQAFAPQQQVIDEQIQANEVSGQAQLQGLDVQKKAEFGSIEQAASDRGMFFSGFSPDEQAKYLGGSYLPKVAELQGVIAQGRANLMGKKADFETAAFDKATNMREQDMAILRDWEKMTAQQQFEASEAEKQRVFNARQNELDRQASAARSSSGAAATPTISKNAAGGWEVSDPNMDLAGYARATGKDLITLMLQGDAQDRQAAQWYLDKIQKYGPENAPQYFLELQRDRPTAFYRGG